MYDKLTPNLITLIYEYDNTYREIFNVVLEELQITVKIRPKYNNYTYEQWKQQLDYELKGKNKDEKAYFIYYCEEINYKGFITYLTTTSLNIIYNTLKQQQTRTNTLINFLGVLLYKINRNRRQGEPHLLFTFINEPYPVNTVPNSSVYNGYDGKFSIVVNK